MYKRSLECLKRCRSENVSFAKFLEVTISSLYMIGIASYRMYINYWQRRTLKYLKFKVGMDHMIQCDVIITDLLRKPVDRLQSYSLVLNVSTVNCQNLKIHFRMKLFGRRFIIVLIQFI